MSTDLSKQEYLKRYLDDDKQNKKHKKKVKPSKCIIPKVKILDYDISIKSLKFGTKEEIEEDDTPVVAEIIDDRPIEIKSKELFHSSKWKTIGEDDTANSDQSPKTTSNKSPNTRLQNSRKRHDSDSDMSPARISIRHDSDSDCSPPRERNIKNKTENNNIRTSKQKHYQQKNSDSDLSPARRVSRNSDSDLSPKRNMRHNSDSDLSPKRKTRHNSDSDLSPERPRRRRSPAAENADSDLSPPRKNADSSALQNSSPRTGKQKPSKTLSGLKAGLQNAATLKKETKELKQRERAQIKELDEELSGRNADTIIRDRQTGKRRNLDEELHVAEQKEKKNQEHQQKYAEWGKGVEQTETKKQKISEDLYEMSKPLARYCDDEDLDERLKAEIHDDDPMAQYMRKKQKKSNPSVYPTYSGPPPPPNRFQIPPGYRWDGVDRSNGFEKKYFEKKSSRKAVETEAYLWSIQDM